MALGLVFDFLLLKGFVCYILYGLNAFIFVSCLFLELKYPQLVHLLSSREVIVCDIAQSLIIITCILQINNNNFKNKTAASAAVFV